MDDIRRLQAPVSASIAKHQPNPGQDARLERDRASFNVRSMGSWLRGGEDALQRREQLEMELQRLPWASKDRRYFLTREEEYVGGLRAALQVWRRMLDKEWSAEDALTVRSMLDWPGGLELHIGMFIPTIQGLGTREQRKEYLPRCSTLEIIGTYAQTELGHGTFVRGLETTATYHAHSRHFVIHSPTQTSTKWWPGGLAKTATHAVVMARLVLSGADYGPHAFVVQLRDLQSHKLLPGIDIGDIGPKMGYNGVDNGFMRFDHLLVPHAAMLARFAKVTLDGQYAPPPRENQKASYSTMLFVRADIVRNAANFLAKAATIAVRYCCVRRQTASAPGQAELQVIDYQNTAATLLPIVAAAYVAHAMGASLWAAYEGYERDRASGNFASLPELHALSAGLKAFVTTATADGIEACRRCCGGHGYSQLSGLPALFSSYVQNVTWEGDNNVMLLQTARYVLKNAVALRGGAALPSAPSLAYLVRGVATHYKAPAGSQGSEEQADRLTWAQQCFASRARYLVERAVAVLVNHHESGGKVVYQGLAWNSSTVPLIEAAQAHCACAMLDAYCRTLQSSKGLGSAESRVLGRLGVVWALHTMRVNLGQFMEAGSIKVPEAVRVHAMFFEELQALRPDAISLVDAWHFSDYELNSALGRKDGQVYEGLLSMARASPLNATEVGPAWEPVLKPAMQRFTSRL